MGEERVLLGIDNKGEHSELGKFVIVNRNFDEELIRQLQDDEEERINRFLEQQETAIICEYFLLGNCRFGSSCKFIHPETSIADKERKELEEKRARKKYIEEHDEECNICLNKVLTNGRKFGVLDGCDHTFCLNCIRNWRSTYDKRVSKLHFRTCPICRQNSYLVIPSDYMCKSGPDKDELIDEYKGTLGLIHCKHFNKGKGECPFRNSCNYAHKLPNGDDY
jgi:E3 ubiquitin-protein ligase makorin